MNIAARTLFALAAISFFTGCRQTALTTARSGKTLSALTSEALAPSPRLIVGRIVGIDPERSFAFIELTPDAPPAAVTAGSELLVRTLDLRETARLRVSRYQRGRMLGTTIVTGKPNADDEVVWLAP